jgi:Alginate lyase
MHSTRITCVFTAVVFATTLSSAALMSPGAQASGRCLPVDIVDLQGWKLTLPVTNAPEIKQPALSVYESSHFSHLSDCTALVFKTPIGGGTTPNSSYSRTELREMTPDGTKLASWSNTSGTHEMSWRVAVDTAPPAKPQFVVGQVHDAEDDVVQVLYDGGEGEEEGGSITYRWLGKTSGVLVSGYQLGTYVDLRIVASGGAFNLYANGALKATESRPSSGLYFKAGSYPQSNPGRGDDPNFVAQVRISNLAVNHAGGSPSGTR